MKRSLLNYSDSLENKHSQNVGDRTFALNLLTSSPGQAALRGRFCAVFFKLSIPLCETCFKQISETLDDRSLCRLHSMLQHFPASGHLFWWHIYIFTKHLTTGLCLHRLFSLCFPCWPLIVSFKRTLGISASHDLWVINHKK